MILKLNPGKERRCDPLKIENIFVSREPPTITTTAATPQDSPSTTLEQGVSFRNWEHLDLESIDKTSVSFYFFCKQKKFLRNTLMI